ncbi:MAG: TIGR02147 family protein [Bdellovibrionaceae bacterium]|nr:TIGR02147 family protein [Bdellovibrio sp.]
MENSTELLSQKLGNSTTSTLLPDLSDYMDYRLYLADFYHAKKSQTRASIRPYSYAIFSAAADIKSPNYLKMIIEGKRNLSNDMISKFGKACGLNKAQGEEFRLLVSFNQAEDPADRNYGLKKLSEYRVEQKLKLGELDRKVFEKVPNWIGWIIFAMVDQAGVNFKIPQLKELLRGKASETEINHALESLIKSGELVRDEATGEIKKGQLTDAPEEIPSALVRKLQMQLMYLGLESLYQDAPAEREFGSLTLAMTEKEFEELKFKLRQLRKSLHKDNSIARMNAKGERVYQLNLQLFPVSNSNKKFNA